MWRDKIIEARVAKGITIQALAEKTKMSEKSVTRILNGTTEFPPIDKVLALGIAVGLSERELFMEANLVVSNEELVALQTELADLRDKCDHLTGEIVRLTDNIVALNAENDTLRTKLAHKEEILAHKDEIITLYKSLQKYQSK